MQEFPLRMRVPSGISPGSTKSKKISPEGPPVSKVGWLIILTPGVFWDIMGYESDPLPSYIKLRNCYYSMMLNLTDSPSTPKVHVTCPGTTMSSSGSSPASALP